MEKQKSIELDGQAALLHRKADPGPDDLVIGDLDKHLETQKEWGRTAAFEAGTIVKIIPNTSFSGPIIDPSPSSFYGNSIWTLKRGGNSLWEVRNYRTGKISPSLRGTALENRAYWTQYKSIDGYTQTSHWHERYDFLHSGNAESISYKSIDLELKTYTNYSGLRGSFRKYIDQAAGGRSTGDKVLSVLVPNTRTNEEQIKAMAWAFDYAESKNVSLVIVADEAIMSWASQAAVHSSHTGVVIPSTLFVLREAGTNN